MPKDTVAAGNEKEMKNKQRQKLQPVLLRELLDACSISEKDSSDHLK